jgi:hypothetical protein
LETHPSLWKQSKFPTFNLLKRFLSSQSTSTSKAITPGTLARIRLILINVWPNSNDSFCDMHFICSTILSCPRLILQFSFFWHDHHSFSQLDWPPILKAVEQVWEANGLPFSAHQCHKCMTNLSFLFSSISGKWDSSPSIRWPQRYTFAGAALEFWTWLVCRVFWKLAFQPPPTTILEPAHGSELLGYKVAVDAL